MVGIYQLRIFFEYVLVVDRSKSESPLASPHIVQATHANAKTKAYPKSVAAPPGGK